MNFTATEFDANTCEATGRTALYIAESIEKAVSNVLYTMRLENRNAKIGPTKRVVYDGFGKGWTVICERH